MTSWFVFIAIAVIAALVVALPSMRRISGGDQRDAFDIEVYRRQLSEVDADHARGVLSETEAVAARLEIERRILALAAKEAATGTPPPPFMRWLGLALVVVTVPALSLAIYGTIGAPGAPDRPLAERAAEAPAPTMPTDVEAAVTKLAARLEQDPNDLEGWLLLGRTYAFMERYEDAATAFASAAALAPDDDDIVVSYGESLSFAAGGMITPAARQQFAIVSARNPEHEGARYFSGMMQIQDGDLQAAFETWTALARSADPATPWLPGVVEQIQALAAELGVEAPEIFVAEAPPPTPMQTPAAAPNASTAPGPDASDLEMAAEMTPEERTSMVNSMVARLEGRLIENPDDADGWKRLGRAKRVLEDLPGARAAYENAAAQAPQDLEALAGLAEVEILLGESSEPLPALAVDLYQRILALDERHPESLWFLGLAAAQAGQADDARAFWTRLLAMIPADSDEHQMLSGRIAELAGEE